MLSGEFKEINEIIKIDPYNLSADNEIRQRDEDIIKELLKKYPILDKNKSYKSKLTRDGVQIQFIQTLIPIEPDLSNKDSENFKITEAILKDYHEIFPYNHYVYKNAATGESKSVWFNKMVYPFYPRKNKLRYGIADPKLIGEGGFGRVLPVDHKINHDRNEKKPSHYVNKYIHNRHLINPDLTLEQANDEFKKEVMKEYELSKRVKDLHIKPPYFITKAGKITHAHLTMYLLPEMNLAEYIKTTNNIDFDVVLEQGIQLFRALAKQIHNNNIVHRDIRPENIIINTQTNQLYFIDLGLSKDNREKSKDNVGNPIYSSPEQFATPPSSSKASDYWAMGIILAKMFGLENPFEQILHGYRHEVIIKQGSTYTLEKLNKIAEKKKWKLSSKLAHAEKFINLLNGLLTIDPKKRDVWGEHAVNILENIRLERLLAATTPIYSTLVEAANNNGRLLRDKCDFLEKNAGTNISDYLQFLITEVKPVVEKNEFANVGISLSEFLIKLDIKSLFFYKQEDIKGKQKIDDATSVINNNLSPINNKEQLLVKIDELVLKLQKTQDIFQNINNLIIKLKPFEDYPPVSILIKNLLAESDKINKNYFTIDNIANFYDKYRLKTQPLIKDAKRLLVNLEKNSEIFIKYIIPLTQYKKSFERVNVSLLQLNEIDLSGNNIGLLTEIIKNNDVQIFKQFLEICQDTEKRLVDNFKKQYNSPEIKPKLNKLTKLRWLLTKLASSFSKESSAAWKMEHAKITNIYGKDNFLSIEEVDKRTKIIDQYLHENFKNYLIYKVCSYIQYKLNKLSAKKFSKEISTVKDILEKFKDENYTAKDAIIELGDIITKLPEARRNNIVAIFDAVNNKNNKTSDFSSLKERINVLKRGMLPPINFFGAGRSRLWYMTDMALRAFSIEPKVAKVIDKKYNPLNPRRGMTK